MLFRDLTEYFLGLLHEGVSDLKDVETDWGQLELTGSVFADPAALVSLDEFSFACGSGGTDFDCVLSVKLVWKRMDRLNAGNPRLGHFLEPMDLLDGVRTALEGQGSGDLVREVRLKSVGLANDQQTNYKAFHKSYECFILIFKVKGFEAEERETVRLGSLGEVITRVRFKVIKA
jgi:hypothetical protein